MPMTRCPFFKILRPKNRKAYLLFRFGDEGKRRGGFIASTVLDIDFNLVWLSRWPVPVRQPRSTLLSDHPRLQSS